MLNNFVTYANATELFTEVGNKFRAFGGAYVARGNSTFANLPAALTKAMTGYVYNVTDDFTTDSRFVEGSGKKYSAGTNVVIVDNSTYTAVEPVGNENPVTEGWYELNSGEYVLSEDTAVDAQKTYYQYNIILKYDVVSTFVDVDAISTQLDNTRGLIAAEYNPSNIYQPGDYCIYNNRLYRCVSTNQGIWSDNDFAYVYNVTSVIQSVDRDLPKTTQFATFDSSGDTLDKYLTFPKIRARQGQYSWGRIVISGGLEEKYKSSSSANPQTKEITFSGAFYIIKDEQQNSYHIYDVSNIHGGSSPAPYYTNCYNCGSENDHIYIGLGSNNSAAVYLRKLIEIEAPSGSAYPYVLAVKLYPTELSVVNKAIVVVDAFFV